jgi:hypothetical protein
MGILEDVLCKVVDLNPLNPNLEFPRDLYSVPVWIGIWFAFHFTLFNIVFKPLGVWFFPAPKDEKSLKYLNERHKLHTACWKFSYFTSTASMGLYIMATESWFLDPSQYFVGWPNQPMSDFLRLYYNAQTAGYFYAFLLMPFEPKQTVADYAALSVHHASTIFLLWKSYVGGWFRIGIVIATLHDLSDPFMEIAKIFLYAGRSTVILFNLAG